uniref:Uncharacterized protein n=1 Tax=Nothobranchius furzeri TaxID=105023 RepID=A0A8C6NKN8_NOTFU
MAAVCVQAELRLRDGQNRTVGVVVGNGLSALRSGISELNAKVSQILTELVDRERPRGGCTRGELFLESRDNLFRVSNFGLGLFFIFIFFIIKCFLQFLVRHFGLGVDRSR